MTKGKIRQAASSFKTQNEPIDTEMPLAVLVNGNTASASEILSGSMQDMDRAVIIGTRTYGKGLVQTTRPLPYNGTLKVTTSKYYIPSGRCIQAIDYAKKNADGSVARIPDSLTTVFHTAAGREVRDGGGIRPDIEVKGDKFPNILFYLMNDDLIFDYVTQYCLTHPAVTSVDSIRITRPDIEVKGDKFPNILFYLMNDDLIFDYVTQYCLTHPAVTSVDSIRITDADYAEFKKQVKAAKFYLMNDDLIFDYVTQYCLTHPAVTSVDSIRITDADYAEFKKQVKAANFTYDRQSEGLLKTLKEVAEFEGYMEGAAEEFKALEQKLNHNLDRDLDYFAKPIKEQIAEEIATRYFYQRGAVMQRLKDDEDLDKAIEVLNSPEKYKEILSVPVKVAEKQK